MPGIASWRFLPQASVGVGSWMCSNPPLPTFHDLKFPRHCSTSYQSPESSCRRHPNSVASKPISDYQIRGRSHSGFSTLHRILFFHVGLCSFALYVCLITFFLRLPVVFFCTFHTCSYLPIMSDRLPLNYKTLVLYFQSHDMPSRSTRDPSQSGSFWSYLGFFSSIT